MDKTQAYQVLRLKPDSSFSEIKYAYRRLALQYHPDKNGEKDGIRFKMVTEAYHLLKNNVKIANSTPKYTKTKKEEKFYQTGWGAKVGGTPQQDWSKYTRQAEQNDPFFWKNYVAEFWRNYEARTTHNTKYDFTINKEDGVAVNVDVDHSKCIGCCSCEIIAPRVFWVDKNSKMNPKSNVVNKKGDNSEKILDAAQTCPTKAINVDEEETGRRLFPY